MAKARRDVGFFVYNMLETPLAWASPFISASISNRLTTFQSLHIRRQPTRDRYQGSSESLTFSSISLHDESGQMENIERYIKFAINKDTRNGSERGKRRTNNLWSIS